MLKTIVFASSLAVSAGLSLAHSGQFGYGAGARDLLAENTVEEIIEDDITEMEVDGFGFGSGSGSGDFGSGSGDFGSGSGVETFDNWDENSPSVGDHLRVAGWVEDGAEEGDEPVVEKPAEPVVEEPVEPVVEEPVEPVVEESAEPAVEEPVEPVVEEPAEPAVEEPVEPVVEEPVKPVVEEPVVEKVDYCTKLHIVCPANLKCVNTKIECDPAAPFCFAYECVEGESTEPEQVEQTAEPTAAPVIVKPPVAIAPPVAVNVLPVKPTEKETMKQLFPGFKGTSVGQLFRPRQSFQPQQPQQWFQPQWSQPQPKYFKPKPKYVEPKPKYVEPKPKYVEPKPKYVQPKPKYVQPKYVQPKPKYVEPKPKYVQPKPKYVQPKPKYVEPKPKYVQPRYVEPLYVEPTESSIDLVLLWALLRDDDGSDDKRADKFLKYSILSSVTGRSAP